MPHAFVIEADEEQGVERTLSWAKEELGMSIEKNPDISVLRYRLFSVEDARQVALAVAGAPFVGEHKVVVIAASRAYHEAQNALLKIFEEPPRGTHLFLILPSLGNLLPTLRSRVQVLSVEEGNAAIAEIAQEFLKAGSEKRSALIKRLSSGKDEEERREHRQEAIALLNGIEAVVYGKGIQGGADSALLTDIATLRGYLYDRSAPTKMILEHLSLVIPARLL
jgi:DNA polymerase III delta prime subunit